MKKYEEELKKAANLLLEQYWIVQEVQPKEFELVKTFEPELITWFREQFGYELVIHRKVFARLEKIPAKANENMVLDPDLFKTPLDYTILFAMLAFFENKYDETFLISEFLDELRVVVGEEDGRFLEKHRNRLSIIRVFKYAVKMGFLIKRDGDIETFEQEVLFKVPPVARYFMRQFPCAVQEGLSSPSLWTRLEEDSHRHRVYRSLLLEPAIIYSEMAADDVQYIKKHFPVIAENVYKHTSFRAESYTEEIVVVRSDPEGSTARDYPSDSSLSDIALQIGECLKIGYLENEYQPDNAGWVHMSTLDWGRMIWDLKKVFGTYWKKEFSEMKREKLIEEITQYLESWNMIERSDAHVVRIAPHIVRVTGKMLDMGEQKNELETK